MNAQQALASTGIPIYAGAWRETEEHARPPEAYIVHTQMRVEDFHDDDRLEDYRLFVYASLWSEADPTKLAARVRNTMHAEGWAMDEETTDYDEEAKRFHVAWTWVRLEDATDADGD